MKPFHMKRKALSASIAAAILGTMSVGSFAQDTSSDAEEIVITGIRASLTNAMDIKRSATGVVDAISAEDIGKMPDTNLAESLQRITGVSIDRANGEGSKITVRGFGPDYNLITLNNRQMPAANLQATAASNSRSFDFANLAAESVAGVEVYKTGNAMLATGGLGSTVNIKTARPLDMGGLKASIGAKAIMDTSNRSDSEGSSVTPEVSGIFSNTFADNTFGITLSGNYAERDNGQNAAETSSGWYSIKDSEENPDRGGGTLPTNGSIQNRPGNTDLYSLPQNLMYSIQDVQRKRTNAQLTLQWAPTEIVTQTLDYTYSKQDLETQRQELSVWFNRQPTTGTIFSDGPVAGPLIYADNSGADIGMGVGNWGTTNQNNSLGYNMKIKPTDNLTIDVDLHHSTAQAGGKDDRGSNNVATAVHYNRNFGTVDYTKDFPVLTIGYIDGLGLDQTKFISSGTSFRNAMMRNEIDQYQLGGTYAFDEGIVKTINFGLASTTAYNRSAYSNNQRNTWGGYGAAADYADDIFIRKDLAGEFDNIDGSNSQNLQPYYYDVDFNRFIAAIGAVGKANNDTAGFGVCGFKLCADPSMQVDRRVTEETLAAYLKGDLAWDIGSMPAHLALGVRYEETDVDARAVVPIYTTLEWSADNELTPMGTGSDFNKLKGSYANWLPNVDFDISIIDDLKLRASYGITIARPGYDKIQGGQTINIPVRINGGTGNSGNPDLDPLESKNLDISAEWYYSEGSYLSAGYFRKDVKNFLGENIVNTPLFNLAHPAQGTRYNQAVAAAVAAGRATTPTAIRADMEALYGRPVVGSSALGDPATVFALNTPVNARTAVVDGFEFAVQQLFGESGFGGIINFTVVNIDTEYDNYNRNKLDDADNQFVLPGLSDSYNVVGFYDNYGFQARVAYNWRDKFIASTLDGNGQPNPIYTEAYGQVDVSFSYDITDQLTVSLEGLNVTDEIQRLSGRTETEVVYVGQSGPRFNLGARYAF